MFTFTPPASRKAANFLERSAKHLRSLPAHERKTWFEHWTPKVADMPLGDGVTAADKSLVILTVDRWAAEAEAMVRPLAVATCDRGPDVERLVPRQFPEDRR